jgi:exo-1,4-beta-D-glucosaminidase
MKTHLNYTVLMTALLLFSCNNNPDQMADLNNFGQGWRLFSSATITADGAMISSPDFDSDFGYPIEVPSTVMHGLRQNGLLPDIFAPFVLEGMDKAPYEVPWWYRKEFELGDLTESDFFQITFDGINFRANIWLNGTQIARSDSVQGSYGVWNFDISKVVRPGRNHLAVEIIPPVFGKDIHKGFVDWNPTPPDRLMGIWREVHLRHTGPVSMRHSNVVSKVNKETLDEAELTISTELTNHSGESQMATVIARFGNVSLTQKVQLPSGGKEEIFFRPLNYSELKLKNPDLWWPNNLGEQHLHDIRIEVIVDGNSSDSDNFRFGIREIEDFWNESGYRGFMVNGRKVMLRSAGWVDDIFLGDPDEKVEAQMRYAKHLNLNSIRLESFWGKNRTLMDKADEYGLLLMLGWSAHWEWEGYIGIPHDEYVTIRGEEEKALHAANYRDQVMWHRRHPSVAIWTYGSDKLPRPSLEIMLNEIMAKADTTRPILSYCGGAMLMGPDDPRASTISGPTGVKMEGPYDWVAPVYWYIDKRYGGAFGFNTEVGPGPQIPPLSSIKKMIPEKDLWPVNDTWLYYSGRNNFENLDRFLGAFHARYGKSDNLEDFLFMNQVSSYEAIRPMFEAFAVNKFHSTGVVQWMYNSAWPTFYWQLFDYFLMPNGAFYGTRKAAAPLTAIYNYGDRNIHVNNDHLYPHSGLNVEAKVYDINSRLLFRTDTTFDIPENSALKVIDMPAIEGLSTTYFLDLRLKDDNGNEIANNFYWLSTKDDVPDFGRTTWYWTPNSQHADLTAISSMPETGIDFSYSARENDGKIHFTADLKNPSDRIAFFIEVQIVNRRNNEPVLPVYWNDNYISLQPGETRRIEGYVDKGSQRTRDLVVTMQGLNVR